MSALRRVVMVNGSARLVGGAERYLADMAGALAARGVEVALLAETEGPPGREPLDEAAPAGRWIVAERGAAGALDAVRAWRPDLVVTHGVHEPALEQALQGVAPAVLVTHNYHGTCISGEKTHKAIVPRQCERPLGPPCLLHYFPNRCGGLDPRTMLRMWHRQRARQALLPRYAGVVALSRHMVDEVVRNGVAAARTHVVPPPVALPDAPAAPAFAAPWRLVLVGRLDPLKGGRVLLDALPRVAAQLGARVELDVVGDGPERAALEARAAGLDASATTVRFHGWLHGGAVRDVVGRAHLLVVPSLWPEPFGLVGLEAAALGTPAVAFAVGGIPDWLADGVNGVLVPTRGRRAASLAAGVVRALGDAGTYARLRAGARDVAARSNRARFDARVLEVLDAVHAAAT